MVEIASFPSTSAVSKSRLMRLARVGVWVSTIALGIAFFALCYTAYATVTGHPQLMSDLLEEFGLAGHLDTITQEQRWVLVLLSSLVDMLGIAMVWSIRKLFLTYRGGEIFSNAAARRLRQIGWIILAMAPVSILAILVGGVGVSLWSMHIGIPYDGIHGQITIDDTDVYAIIIGLVLVAAGHMMTLASDIDAENREFI